MTNNSIPNSFLKISSEKIAMVDIIQWKCLVNTRIKIDTCRYLENWIRSDLFTSCAEYYYIYIWTILG